MDSDSGSVFSMWFSLLPTVMFIIYGLFILLGLYSLYLFIKLAIQGINALDTLMKRKISDYNPNLNN
jgi:hypothetical protein